MRTNRQTVLLANRVSLTPGFSRVICNFRDDKTVSTVLFNARKTVQTVFFSSNPRHTRLKPGVNEMETTMVDLRTNF